jgi:hypothetical protein
MAKFLLAIFLMTSGYKLIADMPAFYQLKVAKQALSLEDFKETEKEKKERKNSESESKYFISSAYWNNLAEDQKLTAKLTSFENSKLHSGYTNPAFTPPNLISF